MGNDKVVPIPHLGASTEEAEENCAIMVADQLIDFLENGNIKNSVNFPNIALERNGGSDDSVPLVQRESATRLLPLSWAQQRLWMLDQLEPGSAAYNLPWVARLTGTLDEDALQQAVNAVAVRQAHSVHHVFQDSSCLFW